VLATDIADRSADKETGLSEQRKYRSWTAQQKLEIVLAGMRGVERPMLSPTPDSLSGGYAPSEPVQPKSANRQHGTGERSTQRTDADGEPPIGGGASEHEVVALGLVC
jgi:hypothetical protein